MLDGLDTATLDALGELAGRLKHDLGKYVAFQLRWLPPDASSEERRAALESDLLATRRGPDGTVDALAVWAEFEPILTGSADLPGGGRVDLSADPSVAAIAGAMRVISRIIDLLRDDSAGPDDVEAGAEAAFAVADSCRDLLRRVRSA